MSAATLTSDKVVSMHATSSAVPAPAANEAAAPVAKAAPREPRTPISEILLAVFKAVFPPIAGMALLAIFQPGEAGTPMVTVSVSGKVKEVLLYAEPMSRTCMWMWEVGIGCQNLRCR